MEMVGLPQDYVVKLLAAALGKVALSAYDAAQAADHLTRLIPKTSQRASLDKPTGTAETITIDKTLEQASSVSATPSWTVSHG